MASSPFYLNNVESSREDIPSRTSESRSYVYSEFLSLLFLPLLISGLWGVVPIPSEHGFDGLDRESAQAAAVTSSARQSLPLAIAFAIAITVAFHVAQFTAVAEPAWRQ